MDQLENPNSPPARVIELSRRQWLLVRVVVAGLFGATIIFCSLAAAYNNAKDSPYVSPYLNTLSRLKMLTLDIDLYQQDHHMLPRTLDAFHDGQELDVWGHPFIYTIHGDDYTLVSYGQDGKPGGTGWDADITSNDLTSHQLRPPRFVPSYKQFLNGPETQEAIRTAWITGLLAAVICFVTMQPRPRDRWSIGGLIAKIGVVLFAAIIVGMTITILHLPQGH